MRQLRFSRSSNLALAHNRAHQFAARHALCHYTSNSIYTFIPKNGCSTLRLSLAISNGCIPDAGYHPWIHSNNGTFSATLRDLVTAQFSFVVLRDPLNRLSSVYLDKIVNREPQFWDFQDSSARAFQPEEVTFRAFAQTVCTKLLTSNVHWRPQGHFLVYDDYDLWVPLERFEDFVSEIEERTGFAITDARPYTLHGSDRFNLVENGCFADARPADIRQMNREGQTPSHRAMFDSDLRRIVSKAYSADIELYAARFPRPHLAAVTN